MVPRDPLLEALSELRRLRVENARLRHLLAGTAILPDRPVPRAQFVPLTLTWEDASAHAFRLSRGWLHRNIALLPGFPRPRVIAGHSRFVTAEVEAWVERELRKLTGDAPATAVAHPAVSPSDGYHNGGMTDDELARLKEMREQGYSLSAMARSLGYARATISGRIKAMGLPPRAPRAPAAVTVYNVRAVSPKGRAPRKALSGPRVPKHR